MPQQGACGLPEMNGFSMGRLQVAVTCSSEDLGVWLVRNRRWFGKVALSSPQQPVKSSAAGQPSELQ